MRNKDQEQKVTILGRIGQIRASICFIYMVTIIQQQLESCGRCCTAWKLCNDLCLLHMLMLLPWLYLPLAKKSKVLLMQVSIGLRYEAGSPKR